MTASTRPSATTDASGRPLVPEEPRGPSFKRDRLPVLLGVLVGLAIVAFTVWMTVRGQQLAGELEEYNADHRIPLEQTAAYGLPEAQYMVAPDADATESFSENEVEDALERVLWANQQGRHSFTVGQTDLDDLLALYEAKQRSEIEAAMGTIDALDYVTVIEDELATAVRAEAVTFSYEEVRVAGEPVLQVHTTIFWAYGFQGDRSTDPMEHTVFLEQSADWQIDAADVDAGLRLVASEVNLANPDCAAAGRGVLAALPYEQWQDGAWAASDCRG